VSALNAQQQSNAALQQSTQAVIALQTVAAANQNLAQRLMQSDADRATLTAALYAERARFDLLVKLTLGVILALAIAIGFIAYMAVRLSRPLLPANVKLIPAIDLRRPSIPENGKMEMETVHVDAT
jgi:hypothetical protein